MIGRAHRADHVDAVAAGHEDVDERHVRVVCLEHAERLHAVGEPDYRAAQVWEWAARGFAGYSEMTNLSGRATGAAAE